MNKGIIIFTVAGIAAGVLIKILLYDTPASPPIFSQFIHVAYVGQDLRTSLDISNDDWHSDSVDKVISECGCTTIGAKGKVVAPFGAITVPVEIRVDGFEGVRSWRGAIFFTSGRQVPYQITAEVRTPHVLTLGKVSQRGDLEREFTVPLSAALTEPVAQVYGSQGWQVALNAEKEDREIAVAIVRTGPLPIGAFDHGLIVPIGSAAIPEFWFRLQGDLENPFKISPDFLRVSGESGELGGPIRVVVNDKQPFEVVAAWSYDLGVTSVVRQESEFTTLVDFSGLMDLSDMSPSPYVALMVRWRDEEYVRHIPVVVVTRPEAA